MPGLSYSDDQIARALELWIETGSCSEAARLTGISHQTIRRHKAKRPDLHSRMVVAHAHAREAEQTCVAENARGLALEIERQRVKLEETTDAAERFALVKELESLTRAHERQDRIARLDRGEPTERRSDDSRTDAELKADLERALTEAGYVVTGTAV